MGNTSTVRATVIFDEPPAFSIRHVDTKLVLVPSDGSDLKLVTIGTKKPSSRRWDLTHFPVSLLVSSEEGVVLPVDPSAKGLLKISAKNFNGTSSHPVFLAALETKASNTSLTIKKEFVRDFLYLSVSSHLPFTLRPSLWIVHGEEKRLVDLNALDERTYFGTIPLSLFGGGVVRLEAQGDVNGTGVESFEEFSVYPISTEGGTVVAGDGEFSIEFVPDGVYSTLYCRVEQSPEGYSVYPKDVLLKKGAIVRYALPASVSIATAGLFFEDETDFRLLGSPDPDQPGELTGRVTRLLGDFSVLPDSIPPSISHPSIWYWRGKLQIVFGLRDNRSDIHPDRIRIMLDNELLIGEYDPDKKRVTFEEELTLLPGSHELRVEAGDRLGNTQVITRSFSIGAQ